MKKILLIVLAASLMLAGCAGSGENSASVGGTDAITNIMNRKSVRSFTGEKLSQEQTETLLKAAMAAPTGMNAQPWRFVVLNDPAVIADVFANERGEMYKQAGAVFIVCGQTTVMQRPWGQENAEPQEVPNQFWYEDCGASTENLLLAAEALGLGAVWIGCYPIQAKIDNLRAKLGIPENVMPYAIVPVGYPAGNDQPKDKWKPENVHYNKW
ncbi:MAG: nitroreductase family protein [Bacteroidales bacterium]|nr:nitroreductase family protein [Bacteroidales bacterium]MBQ9172931.1 nitroreductase family protein [Bacteroidales bacterium]MBQ9710896.1 nitroreductase family protein [Bacteroidales bacterium]MBR1433584.1 nitroreductase family protein [Bacteroidales bacterium]